MPTNDEVAMQLYSGTCHLRPPCQGLIPVSLVIDGKTGVSGFHGTLNYGHK